MQNRFSTILIALLFSGISTLTAAAETTSPEGAQGHDDLSYATQKSMDPKVWMKLMNSMMSGELQGQPAIASCVECHTNEDIARYQKDFGGMMQMMNPMLQMANPQMYGAMPGMMMNPMMGMMNPMMGMMMNPMTGMMMNPMTGMMMNPMTGMMMNPMTGMMMPQMQGMMPQMQGMMPQTQGMMPQMQGMMPQMQGMMPQMQGMMPQMHGMMNPGGSTTPGATPGKPQMMNPQQYEQYYKQWQDMMSQMGQPKADDGAAQ